MGNYKLKDLLKGVDNYYLNGDEQALISSLRIDSRAVENGSLFAAIPGSLSDGHDFIDHAIGKGAVAVLCEEMPEVKKGISYVKVENVRIAIGLIAHEYYDRPSEKLKCIGVTGTNGKTTVVTLLYDLFKELGYKVGLISTVEILVNDKKLETRLTTPDVISLHDIISEMVMTRCTHVFMEVSSHAVDQRRISGISFAGGVFTNITHDHLDYHETFSNYLKAKQSFFSGLDEEAFALINIDDRNGEVMVQNSKARCFRYSQRIMTDYKSRLLSDDELGMHVEIAGYRFHSRLTGRFNVANLTAVFAVADIAENIEAEELAEKMSGLNPVKGRMEMIALKPRIIVDYAHSPDALTNALNSLKGSLKEGKLIVVIGCGGDRDKLKRPIMGLIAIDHSDLAIFTSDNPRNEDPEQIIRDMKKEIPDDRENEWLEIENRKSAIKVAIKSASENDTILIAGKGHEEYQEIKGVKYFFSDQQIVKDILSKDI